MDMQGNPIVNTSDISSVSITTVDMWSNGTSTNNNLTIGGNLTFGPGAMIYVDGIMIDPSNLANATIPSPTLDSGYEERITKLELKNRDLKEKLEIVVNKIEFLEKWSEV